MSIHYGMLSTANKTDLTDIERRLAALETASESHKKRIDTNKTNIETERSRLDANKADIVTERSLSRVDANKADIVTEKARITANTGSIITNTGKITTAQSRADSAYTYANNAYVKAVSNGDKILHKLRFSENFDFGYENSTVGNWSVPVAYKTGHPFSHVPLLNIDSETYIHLQFHQFDTDVTLDSEKAEYRISFVDNAGNVTSWTSPTQTISSGKLHSTMFVVDVLCHISANMNNWQNLRVFSIAYKPICPSKVNGNESRLFVNVYSKG